MTLNSELLTESNQQAIVELDSVMNLLEQRLPASVDSPRNEKLRKALERDVADYFRALETAFPMQEIENLYMKLVKQD